MRTLLCTLTLLVVGFGSASADQRFLVETGLVNPLPGWIEFCKNDPSECVADPRPPTVIRWTRENMLALAWVNHRVNRYIIPMTDEAQWGVTDRWNYPIHGVGDCEDYVLEKRRLLIGRGFPVQALLITYVKEFGSGGHAVLTIRTDDGDYILDNQHEGLLRWNEVPYSYRSRQSQKDPNIWVTLSPPPPPITTAKVKVVGLPEVHPK